MACLSSHHNQSVYFKRVQWKVLSGVETAALVDSPARLEELLWLGPPSREPSELINARFNIIALLPVPTEQTTRQPQL